MLHAICFLSSFFDATLIFIILRFAAIFFSSNADFSAAAADFFIF